MTAFDMTHYESAEAEIVDAREQMDHGQPATSSLHLAIAHGLLALVDMGAQLSLDQRKANRELAEIKAALTEVPRTLRPATEPQEQAGSDPADTCQPGDPDPTPNVEVHCYAESPDEVYMCSRARGHDGQHVAEYERHVGAVWQRVTRDGVTTSTYSTWDGSR